MEIGDNNLKNKALGGLLWVFFERWGAQSISIIVSFILARLLLPDDYGKVALCSVFLTILNNFVTCGMGTALIQKKNADDLDFSSLFYFNVILGVLLFVLLFIAAPYISLFFKKGDLVAIIRVLGIFFIISSVKEIQCSYAFKNLLFKKFFFATLWGTVIAAIGGVFAAYNGLGAWSLIIQMLVNNFIDTLILWFTVKWRPKFLFSFERLGKLFQFGWKMMVSGLIDNAYQNLRQLLIGKLYTPADLAFYEKGSSLPRLVVSNINHSIDNVLFPTLASVQDDMVRLKAMTRRAITVSTFILAPMLLGMAACASSIIKILLTEKWLFAEPFMVIACITFVFYPIHTANLNAIKAMGRSDIFVKLEIIKKIVGLIIIFSTIRYGVLVLAYGSIVTSIIGQIINSWPNKKLLKYGYIEQIKDIAPNLCIAFCMFCVVFSLKYLINSTYFLFVAQVILGISLYIGLAYVTRNENYEYIKGIIMSKFFHKRV